METKSIINGFIIGAAVGVAAGLLLAPASGDRTKKKLIRGAIKTKKNLESYVDESVDMLRHQFNRKIDGLSDDGHKAINRASEKVKI